jgi:hypothetical protein
MGGRDEYNLPEKKMFLHKIPAHALKDYDHIIFRG